MAFRFYRMFRRSTAVDRIDDRDDIIQAVHLAETELQNIRFQFAEVGNQDGTEPSVVRSADSGVGVLQDQDICGRFPQLFCRQQENFGIRFAGVDLVPADHTIETVLQAVLFQQEIDFFWLGRGGDGFF